MEQNHFQPFKAWWLAYAYAGRLNTKNLRHARTLHLGIFFVILTMKGRYFPLQHPQVGPKRPTRRIVLSVK